MDISENFSLILTEINTEVRNIKGLWIITGVAEAVANNIIVVIN